MGFRFRKSLNLGGGFKINFSKSGIGYSAGGNGFRVTKTAKGTTRTTASIPGSGLSYVTESGKGKRKSKSASYTASELPQVKDYSNTSAPRSSKYYDFRYYSLKFCPIPLIILFIFIIIFGLSGDLINDNGAAVSGLAAAPGIIVFIIGWFIIFHIARFIFFHIPAGYNSRFKYHDKLLKFCTLAETAAKRERKKFEAEFADTVEYAHKSENENFSEEGWQAAVTEANKIFDETFNLNTEKDIADISVYSLLNIDKSFNGVTSCYNILNKKATAFKKENRMELAIACLRKLNEYMDASGANYLPDDYLRLVEYLKFNRQFDEARKELSNLEAKHPELCGPVHNHKLDETIEKAVSLDQDLIIFHTVNTCPLCSQYKNRIYSISGSNTTYPPLSSVPDFLSKDRCHICDCVIGVSTVSNLFLSEHPDIAEYNTTPIQDRRTAEQKAFFDKDKLEKARKQIAKIEYDLLWEFMPEICPKNLAAYSKMKNSNSENFQKIAAAAQADGITINII